MRRHPFARSALTGLTMIAGICAAAGAQANNLEYSPTNQKNLTQIGVTQSLHATTDGTGVGIAIFDSLVDVNHVDLAGRTNTYVYGGGTYTRYGDHGTHVAGIAAAGANGIGIVGVAPGARIYSYGVFDDRGWIANDQGRAALNSVRSLNLGGANIKAVNMSYGPTARGDAFLAGELALFSEFRNDVVIVRAAGNDGVNLVFEPFAGQASRDLSHLLIVGAVDGNNNIASYSNKPGTACISIVSICAASERISNFFIVAPGSSILSDIPGQQLGYMSGTSMAAPHVTGAVALIAQDGLNKNTPLTPSQIVEIIKRSATDLGAKGVDAVFGWGLLNVKAALAPVGNVTVVTTPTVPTPPPPPAAGTPATNPNLPKPPAPPKAPPRVPPKFGKGFYTAGGATDPSLFAGIVVFDDYGRPFEADPAAFAGQVRTPSATRGLSMLGILSIEETLAAEIGDASFSAWNAEGPDGRFTSSFHAIAGGSEFSFGAGNPEIFLSEMPGAGAGKSAAAPFARIMYSSLGEAQGIFDEAVSASAVIPLSDEIDGHFFGLSNIGMNRQDTSLTLTGQETADADGSFAAFGLSWRFAENWRLGGSFGALHEQGTLAGIESEGAFSLGSEALTRSYGIHLTGKPAENLSITAFYTQSVIDSFGTESSLFEAARGWSGDHYGVTFDARDAIRDNSLLRLSVLKPLQISDGDVFVRVPVGREMDGTVNYDRRRSSFDGSTLPLETRIEYVERSRYGAYGIALDWFDADVKGSGESGMAVAAGLSLRF
ncbi:MAG: S8 family serine peptidase [Parvibaculum sp.]|nr:S8 family serine peptidase [Parvibaculum sp.]